MIAVDLISSLSAFLAIPYQKSIPIEIFLQVHRDTHGIAAAQNQPFPEYPKVHLFRVAVKSCGVFESCILAWLLLNPTVETQTFDSLSTAILAFSDNFDQSAMAASLGYSAAVVTSTVTSSPPIHDLIAAAVSAAFIAHSGMPQTHPPAHTKMEDKYCWTHGTKASHTSAECRRHKNGHKERATAATKMGGNPA